MSTEAFKMKFWVVRLLEAAPALDLEPGWHIFNTMGGMFGGKDRRGPFDTVQKAADVQKELQDRDAGDDE